MFQVKKSENKYYEIVQFTSNVSDRINKRTFYFNQVYDESEDIQPLINTMIITNEKRDCNLIFIGSSGAGKSFNLANALLFIFTKKGNGKTMEIHSIKITEFYVEPVNNETSHDLLKSSDKVSIDDVNKALANRKKKNSLLNQNSSDSDVIISIIWKTGYKLEILDFMGNEPIPETDSKEERDHFVKINNKFFNFTFLLNKEYKTGICNMTKVGVKFQVIENFNKNAFSFILLCLNPYQITLPMNKKKKKNSIDDDKEEKEKEKIIQMNLQRNINNIHHISLHYKIVNSLAN